MSTTTIRIEDELKQRIATAAERSGKTSHAFILEAIEQTVEQAELDNAFHQIADERWSRLLETGKTVGWEDTRRYLDARAQGKPARKPMARKVVR